MTEIDISNIGNFLNLSSETEHPVATVDPCIRFHANAV
jgi:hypothetical protein